MHFDRAPNHCLYERISYQGHGRPGVQISGQNSRRITRQ